MIYCDGKFACLQITKITKNTCSENFSHFQETLSESVHLHYISRFLDCNFIKNYLIIDLYIGNMQETEQKFWKYRSFLKVTIQIKRSISAPTILQNLNPLSENPTKWSNILKQLISSLLPTNCFRIFDHFVRLALKGLQNDESVCKIQQKYFYLCWFWVKLQDNT